MRSLHLGQQRQDVLGVGHKGGVAQVIGDGLVALTVERGLNQVLDVRDARDVVGILVIDGDAAKAGLAHGGQHVGDRLVVLAHGGVHARHHDLAGNGVAQVEDLVDHALFLVEQVVLLRDHVLDLFLRNVLAVVGALDAQDAGQAIGAGAGQPHERTGDLLEKRQRSHDLLGYALGVGQTDALGHKLADHDGHKGDGDGDDDRRQAARDGGKRRDAKAHEPRGKRVGQTRRGDGGRGEAHERNGDLDGGEQLVGVGSQLNGTLGALVAFLGLVLQHGALGRGERHLGHREVAVDEGQNEGGDKGDGYVHREFLEPPRFGTSG